MNKGICLCLVISLQLVSGFSETDIFKLSNDFISSILNGLQNVSNSTDHIDADHYSKKILRVDQWDDVLCMQQPNSIVDGLNNTELWAMKLIDAWGKIPSGILYGNIYELGQFDECLSIDRPGDNQDMPDLKGQYCLSQISVEYTDGATNLFNKIPAQVLLRQDRRFKGADALLMPKQEKQTTGLNIGICVPDSCSPVRLTEIINNALNVSNISAMVLVSRDLCQTSTSDALSTLDIFTISLFGIICLLMVASTIYDLLMTQYKKNKRIGLTAFSMYSNGQKIFNCKNNKSADAIDCLNGIRVLSIVWVIFGHAHLAFIAGPVINLSYIGEWFTHAYSMLLVSATVSVDSFFLLSGLLVSWLSLRNLEKSNGKMNIFLFYFHRFIRLTPSLAALVLLSSSLIRSFGSGPLWHSYLNMLDLPCQQYWWTTLLYVQNYVKPTHMCLGHSWYLAVDTQLFVLSPLIIYPLWRWRHKFVWIIPILIALSMGCVFALFVVHQYSVKLMTQFASDSMLKTYFPTHTRMGAWLVGVLLGYILHNLKGKSIKIPKIFIAIGWSVAIGTILTIIFGEYSLQQPDYKEAELESAFYASFSRVIWAISLSWIIFACFHGYGGPVNWFLSLPQWQPLAKLSYSMYLVHFPIQILKMASSRTPLNFNDFSVIHQFWGDLGLTLTVSLFWTLAFESPVLMLEKMMFSPENVVVTASREDLVRNDSGSAEAIAPTETHDSEQQQLQSASSKV